MTFTLVLDFLLVVLLCVTIGYAVTLNRRIAALRRDRVAIEKLANSFGEATLRATQGTSRLKATADALQEAAQKATGLGDDLKYLIERATAVADRLEQSVRTARRGERAEEPAPEERGAQADRKGRAPLRAVHGGAEAQGPERALLRALRAAR